MRASGFLLIPMAIGAGIGILRGANIYYGNLHSHTSYSDGQGTPADAYAYARDTAGVDFLAITDHVEQLDDNEWADVKQKAIEFTQDGIFVAIHGFEWGGGITQVGHICTWETQEKPGILEQIYLSTFYEWLAEQPFAIAQFNHPCREGTQDDFNDFEYVEAVDMVINAIEVGNKDEGHEAFEEQYYRALDAGWHLSPTWGQDNHNWDWGSRNEHRTAIIAEALTKDELISAIALRHVYSTEDKNIKLWFYGNGKLMGAILLNEPISFSVQVDDPDSGDIITKLELITNGGVRLDSLIVDSTSVYWAPSVIPPPEIETYYLVRVTSADGSVAFSSPIWVSATGVEEQRNPNSEIQNPKLEIYPNPFMHSTAISYQLPLESEVLLKIYDASGMAVKTLVTEKRPAGCHNVTFDAKGLSSGIYFARLVAGEYKETKKLILVKYW